MGKKDRTKERKESTNKKISPGAKIFVLVHERQRNKTRQRKSTKREEQKKLRNKIGSFSNFLSRSYEVKKKSFPGHRSS